MVTEIHLRGTYLPLPLGFVIWIGRGWPQSAWYIERTDHGWEVNFWRVQVFLERETRHLQAASDMSGGA